MKLAFQTLLAAALFVIGWSWGNRVEIQPEVTSSKVVAPAAANTTTKAPDDVEGLRRALAGDLVLAQASALKLNERDPLQTLNILVESGAGPRAQTLFESAFTALAKRDLEAALRFFREHPALRNILDLRHALVEAAAKDGAGAWQLFLQQRDLLSLTAMQAIAEGWARSDPAAAMAAGSAIADESERAAFLGEVFAGWARKDTKTFLAWLKKQPLDSIVTSLGGQHQWLSAHLDMATLRELAATLPGETLRQAGWQNELETALLDPNQRRIAADWIGKLTDPQLRDESLRALASVMLRSGQTNDIAALLPQVTSAEASTAIASMAAVALALKQPLEAMKFVDDLTDPRAAEMARYSVFDTWLSRDKRAAIEWVKSHYTELPESQRRYLLGKLAADDPQAAFAWAQAQGESELADRAVKSLVRQLGSQTPEKAIQWLSTLPAGRLQNVAISSLASDATQGPLFDFRVAMGLSAQAADPQARRAIGLQVLERWRYLDAKGAQAWLSSAQAGLVLGAEGFVKARELLAKPPPKFPAGNVIVADELGSWQPSALPAENWKVGTTTVRVFH